MVATSGCGNSQFCLKLFSRERRNFVRNSVQELVISVPVHLLEGLVPAGPRFDGWPNNQLSGLHDKIDRSVQLTLLYQRFGNSDPPGVSNSYDMRFHRFVLSSLL